MVLINGTFVHCPTLGKLEILKDWLIAVDDSGYISHSEQVQSPSSLKLLQLHGHEIIKIPPGSFILPSFNDLHLHAPQFLYQGNGLDLPLLQWLQQYTFKAEEKLDRDPVLARKVYRRLGQKLVKAGTGAVCLFGTLKRETNIILAEEMRSTGIRAFVGKVSMDISSRPSYVEPSASAAVQASREFGEQLVENFPSSLVQPVVTPRFVPTCSDELLHGLGALSEEKGWRIQSHMAESGDQVEWVRKERGDEDIHIFEKHNLLTPRTIQAHCTFLSPSFTPQSQSQSPSNQFAHLHTLGTAIAHCPLSNIYFSSTHALCLREALDAHVKVGLGTDIAGGYSLDIMNAMRSCVAVSRIREGEREKERSKEEGNEQSGTPSEKSLAVDWKESLFLATLGGAQALGIESGMFKVGVPFDAQQIKLFDPDTGVAVGALDFFELEMEMETMNTDSDKGISGSEIRESSSTNKTSNSEPEIMGISEEMIEKWWCIGDERNRMGMWVQGARVL